MLTWRFNICHLRGLVVLALLLACTTVHAGLIVEISTDIDISSIKEVHIEGDNLIVIYGGNNRKIIELPRGGMDNLLLWVKQPCSGPFVISVDGALVPGAGTYTSPCLPPNLADAMIGYDVYAHAFGQGNMPYDSMLHPLVLQTGNTSLMPHNRYKLLMDAQNLTPEALWYRSLTTRYPDKPNVIGEFTIKGLPAKQGFPVRINVESHRWFRPQLWYRKVCAPGEPDNLTFDFPYANLKKDIEMRFDAYRKTFKPFDELASFVEAYALLKNIALKKPAMWNRIISEKCRKNSADCIHAKGIFRKSGPESSWDDLWSAKVPWSEWAVNSLGTTIEISQEADLALCLLWNQGGYYNNYDLSYAEVINWENDIVSVAKNSPDIKAKYLLYKIKNEEGEEASNERQRLAEEFFNITSRDKQLMRLRIVGGQIIRDFDRSEEMAEILSDEREKIMNDYIGMVNNLKKKQSADDFLALEDLSQTVYSTGLLRFLKMKLSDDDYRNSYYYDTDFAEALAYVHYRRGLAFQRGEELAYQHAHFRYLGYLSQEVDDATLRKTIYKYQKELAEKMGIQGWDPKDFLNLKYSGYYDEDDPDEETLIADNNSDAVQEEKGIEGYLTDANSLFSGNSNAEYTGDGGPAGIVSRDNGFTLLLIDSRIFAKPEYKGRVLIRASGITYPKVKAITPLIIEIKNKKGEWQRLDIPHSGTSTWGIFNGQ